MKKKALICSLWALLGACESSRIEKDSVPLSPTAGAGGALSSSAGGSSTGSSGASGNEAAGGSSAQAGSAGKISGVAGEAGNAGSSGQTSSSWECPQASSLPGPKMVRLPAPDGFAYCMDSTEVTQGQYNVFYKAQNSKTGPERGEHSACELKNDTFAPQVGKYESHCDPAFFDPEKTPNIPVGCIDWCDAYAYCKWAGKKLCGKFGGGSATAEEAADPAKNQWLYACTQGGKTKYATGETYQEGSCLEGKDITLDDLLENAGSKSECHGSHSPFDQIFDLMGSRSEFTDLCTGEDYKDTCQSYDIMAYSEQGEPPPCNQASLALRGASYSRSAQSGFRCCLDL